MTKSEILTIARSANNCCNRCGQQLELPITPKQRCPTCGRMIERLRLDPNPRQLQARKITIEKWGVAALA